MQEDYKQCPHCKKSYPPTSEFFNKNRAMKGGLANYCKPCKRATNTRSDVSKEKKRNHSREYQRQLRENRPELVKQYKRTYRQENLEKERQRDKNFHWNNREKRLLKISTYYYNNRKKLNEERRERYNNKHEAELKRIRCIVDPEFAETVRANGRKRRALAYGSEGTHSAVDIVKQRDKQNNLCFWCETLLEGSVHVDHVIPLSRGGSNGPENVVISCPTCNLSKGSKTPEEWKAALCQK